MRIVVVGAGKVGRVLTEQLAAEKHDIVVIDQDPDLIESLVNIYDVRGVAHRQVTAAGVRLYGPVTEATDLSNIAFSAASKVTSRTRSTPPVPTTAGRSRARSGCSPMPCTPHRPPPRRSTSRSARSPTR